MDRVSATFGIRQNRVKLDKRHEEDYQWMVRHKPILGNERCPAHAPEISLTRDEGPYEGTPQTAAILIVLPADSCI